MGEKITSPNSMECSGREGQHAGQFSGKGDALKSPIKWAYVEDLALLGRFSNSRLQLDVEGSGCGINSLLLLSVGLCISTGCSPYSF